MSTLVTGTASASRVASVMGTTEGGMAAAGQDTLSLASATLIVTSIGGGGAAGYPLCPLEAEVGSLPLLRRVLLYRVGVTGLHVSKVCFDQLAHLSGGRDVEGGLEISRR